MNKDTLEGTLMQLWGKEKERWAKLTGSELGILEWKRDQRAGLLQERCGIAKDEAEGQVHEFKSKHAPDETEK